MSGSSLHHLSRKTTPSPDEGLGELFSDVQQKRVYSDGKIFADLIPRRRMKAIQEEYLLARQDPAFDLRDFIARHFYEFDSKKTAYKTKPDQPLREHIRELWSVLERTSDQPQGSLIPLPHPYVVPGGRFKEQFYWDSYFIMLGLAADEKWELIEGMVKNHAYLLQKYGFIPTANRTYFLSRSQPPFFSHMVKLLVRHKGRSVLPEYLPALLTEYRFWMHGRRKLADTEHHAYRRVAQMPNGTLLNRYYDNKLTPRPESLLQDVMTADEARSRQKDRLFLHLRAGAESGWDFSSRWFHDPNDITTIHTADIIPVDLNSLLYQLEQTIAEAYRLSGQPERAERFHASAERRARAIEKYCWDEQSGFYRDYNFHQHRHTQCLSLAGVFPLYAKLASTKQAAKVARLVEREFLKEGGLVATQIVNGQQWDAPNGWAPLHWVVIQSLQNYGYHQLAHDITQRWTQTNQRVFESKGKLVEKYDVVHPSRLGGGGEYPLQDGFGWTNGVLAALLDEDSKL